MSTEENIRTVRRYRMDYFGGGDLKLVDALIAETGSRNGQVISREGHDEQVVMWRTGLPDLHFRIVDIFGVRDRVVERYQMCGTNTGELVGFPPKTGRTVGITGMAIHRITDGKIESIWDELDMFRLVHQLTGKPGLYAPPEEC